MITLRVMGWKDAFYADLADIPGILGVSIVARDLAAETVTLRVHHRPGPGVQDVLDCLRPQSVRVVFASEEGPTLEDAFLAMVGGDLR